MYANVDVLSGKIVIKLVGRTALVVQRGPEGRGNSSYRLVRYLAPSLVYRSEGGATEDTGLFIVLSPSYTAQGMTV